MNTILIYLLVGTVLVAILNIVNDSLVKNGLLKKEDSVEFTVPVAIALIVVWPLILIFLLKEAIFSENDDQPGGGGPDNFAY